MRVSNNQPDAIKYYNKAINSIFYESEKYWPVYYALAVSYDKNNEWGKAEESLEKALKLSNRHPQVLNYLGYSWLKYNMNTDKAAAMILEAYEKDPNDGVIMDSLGWVYFKPEIMITPFYIWKRHQNLILKMQLSVIISAMHTGLVGVKMKQYFSGNKLCLKKRNKKS